MLDWLAVLLQTLCEHYLYSALLASLLVLYGIYYSFFSFFRITETPPTGVRTKIRRGKCPPSYPNGWYRLGRSEELKPGYRLSLLQAKFTKPSLQAAILPTIGGMITSFTRCMPIVRTWEPTSARGARSKTPAALSTHSAPP